MLPNALQPYRSNQQDAIQCTLLSWVAGTDGSVDNKHEQMGAGYAVGMGPVPLFELSAPLSLSLLKPLPLPHPLILRRVNDHNSKFMTTSTPDFFSVLSSRTVECSNNRSATETFLCGKQALL